MENKVKVKVDICDLRKLKPGCDLSLEQEVCIAKRCVDPAYFSGAKAVLIQKGLWDFFLVDIKEIDHKKEFSYLFEEKKDPSLEMVSLSDITEKSPEWFIQGYIPKRQITAICGDGGSGKTSVWCAIAAAASRGKQPDFMNDNPFLENIDERLVYYFSGEDTAEFTLKRRLRLYDADFENIKTIPISDERFLDVKFNSDFLYQLIAAGKPALCIFDPVEAFIPADLHMSDRNAMRQCLAPLVGYGEKFGTTFIIIIHSNKRSNAWGRNRIADSADFWDLSRSVLIVGQTKDKGIRYLSQEKCNYAKLSETILFSLNDEKITKHGLTTKRDREFMTEASRERSAPARDEAREFILDSLRDGEMQIKELDEAAKALGLSQSAMRRAKEQLKDEKAVTLRRGSGKIPTWYISLSP